jgi:hypothetical protein
MLALFIIVAVVSGALALVGFNFKMIIVSSLIFTYYYFREVDNA